VRYAVDPWIATVTQGSTASSEGEPAAYRAAGVHRARPSGPARAPVRSTSKGITIPYTTLYVIYPFAVRWRDGGQRVSGTATAALTVAWM
jgi:hypothetical protein